MPRNTDELRDFVTMKILLTGAAGGIGSTLGYYLYKSGHTLTLLDNFRNGYDRNLTINGEKFGKLIPLSVDNIELQDIVEENDFDCIIHFLLSMLCLIVE